jgi:hypothetical protein
MPHTYGNSADKRMTTLNRKVNESGLKHCTGFTNFDLSNDLEQLAELFDKAPPEFSSLIFAMSNHFNVIPMALFVASQNHYTTALGTYQFQNCVMTNFAKELMGTLLTLNAKFFIVNDITS